MTERRMMVMYNDPGPLTPEEEADLAVLLARKYGTYPEAAAGPRDHYSPDPEQGPPEEDLRFAAGPRDEATLASLIEAADTGGDVIHLAVTPTLRAALAKASE